MRVKFVGLFIGLVLCVAASALWADEEEKKIEPGRWYHEAGIALNLTQSSFSNNWRGGENGSLSWTALFVGVAQHRYENGIDWINALSLRFGQTHQQLKDASGDKTWARPEKSEDKIDFETIVILIKGWQVDPYVSARWESKFLDVSDPFGRDLVANPNSFKESAGVARKFLDREDELVLTRLGFTMRQNQRRSFVDETGVSDATESNISHDGGLEFQADWKLKIAKQKISWASKLSAYQPFTWSKASTFDEVSADSLTADGIAADVKDFTTTVDIGWENTFSTQVTKWIAFNLYVELVYDKYDNSVVPKVENGRLTNPADIDAAIRKAGQYKQTFAIGITYTF